MDFLELVQKRYSVRAYKPDPIEPEKLKKILSAARFAPSAANQQPYRLIVIHTHGQQAELHQIYPKEWFVQAPIILCACGILSESWVREDGHSYLDIDIGILMDHITLAAAELGLGTCWIGAFNVTAAREILKIPTGVEPLIFMPIGYPADQIREKERKSLNQIICYEHW